MMLLIVAIIAAVGCGIYWYKTQAEKQKESESGFHINPVVHESEEEEEPEEMIKITVTYNDGTTEVFKSDEQVDIMEGGTLVINLGDEKCVTISPFAYRKIEEVEQ